jgi:hypothetical protein
LNDLRTLRRLFLSERGLKEEDEQGEAVEEMGAAPELTDSAEGVGFTD